MHRLTKTALSSIALSLPFIAACSGGWSEHDSNHTSEVDVVATDATVDDLLAFQASIEEVRLVRQGGDETDNLLSGPVAVDLLALQGDVSWLVREDLNSGEFRGVHVVFTPDAYVARRNDGTEVAVDAVSDELEVNFASKLTLHDDGYRKIVIDFDLAASLSGSVLVPPLVFDPAGSVSASGGSTASTIDELKGVVRSKATGSFVLSAFVDHDSQVRLGDVRVVVDEDTLLIRDNGAAFASIKSFISSLDSGDTVLEVHGNLVDGNVTATRIEVDDNASGGGSENLVKMNGLVLGEGPGNVFVMSISTVDQGSAIVLAALAGPIPATIEVAFDANTVFFLHDDALVTSTALVIGQKVSVKFASFDNAPYTASRIEIENETAQNEGTVTNIGGLPTSLVLHLAAQSSGVLSGQAALITTNVVVNVSSASIYLDTKGHPSLTSAQIPVGMKIEAHGPITGVPGAPTITASKVKVIAGKLDDALVNSITPGVNPSFTTSRGQIDDSFGTNVTAGPQTVTVATECIFTGDASDFTNFLALVQSPPAGSVIELEIEGIGTGVNAIRAYAIKSKIEHL